MMSFPTMGAKFISCLCILVFFPSSTKLDVSYTFFKLKTFPVSPQETQESVEGAAVKCSQVCTHLNALKAESETCGHLYLLARRRK